MDGLKDNLKKLSELIRKLEKGELEVQELIMLEDAARNIYERSVILKFKGFEQSSKPNAVAVDEEEKLVEQEISKPTPFEQQELKEEEPAFDFGIFDQNEPDQPELEEDTEPEIEEHKSVTHSIREEEDHTIETTEVVETKIETTPGGSFYDKLDLEDNSIAARFSGGKVDSLIGSFSLNQRLRFINELFDGSSELFSEAVKTLDSKQSLAEAQEQAASYAGEYSWDPTDEVLIEFLSYLNRRYA
jgi:hypothetical protein